jgi:type IV secretion system protein VirB9
MNRLNVVAGVALALTSIVAVAQESARTVQYHSQDIVPIRAKVKYTTLIVVPPTEKIMEAATGLGDRLKTGHLWSVQNRPLWMA